jgi:hypothetical protein
MNGKNGKDIHKVPITTLYRWYLYDIIGDDANKHIDLFELSLVSEEGNEKELENSELRLSAIETLLPFLNLYANINAEYSFEVHKEQMIKIQGITESMVESSSENLKEFYSNIAFNALISAISAAVDLKLLELNGFFTGIKDNDDEQ